MHFLHSRNPWPYQEMSEPTLGFCLWMLQVDGLRVPPFDQHPDGDGSLRAIGLTAENWQSWFLRVVDSEQRERDIKQLQRRVLAEHFNVSKEPPLPPPSEWHFYHASWRGNDAVRNRLVELHEQYKHVSDHHERLCADVGRAQDKEERRSGTRLYDELKPYSTRIPSLSVYFAVYEYPLDYLVFPATLLMTVQQGQPEPQEYRERVLAAAAELAARPGRRGRQSLYTRIGESASQPTAAYRRYVRKPVPPPQPRQEMPGLQEAAQQIVFEELADERNIFGKVDFTTVQFLREKNRPGWRLYEITFQEIDGEQHRQIFILQQNDDSSWSSNLSGGSSTDMQNQWSEIVAPVHDHPLIFLSANWTGFGNHHFLQTAHGHVIDNGFHVERVRLVNDAGQVLEDAVEDGYVFFACQPGQRVQLPMQAELYDYQGKLVWRQTVPDTGLPPRLK